MNKKKILKIVLIVFLSLIVLTVVSGVAVFQFVIKPNIAPLIESVDKIVNDPEFLAGFEIENEELLQEIENTDLAEIDIEDSFETSPNNTQKPNYKPKKPKTEYKNSYEYVKDNVKSEDFKRGASLASRIDISYILSLLKGGLTTAEKNEMHIYLKKHLSDDEIMEGFNLYNKYSYLLK